MKLLTIILISFLLTSCTTISSQPVITGNTLTIQSVPKFFNKANQQRWNDINYQLKHTSARHIVIYWNGNGGYVDMGNPLINTFNKLRRQGRVIDLYVSTSANSLHAIITCVASNTYFSHSAILLFHPIYEEGEARYSDDQDLFQICVNRGTISNNDVQRMINQKQLLIIDARGDKTFQKDRRKLK